MAVYTRLMAQVGVITGDDKYLVGVCRHNQRSAASFSRITPDWRNNHVMETFWDDFWFGKRPMFGDVTPHYWTALVGDAQIAIEMTFKDAKYRKCADKLFGSTCGLILPDGTATCAIVRPFRVNGAPAAFRERIVLRFLRLPSGPRCTPTLRRSRETRNANAI